MWASDRKVNKVLAARYQTVAARAEARRQLADFEALIEAARRQLGVPESSCAPIEIVTMAQEPSKLFGAVLPGGQPYACVDLTPGPNEVLHIGITLHAAAVHHMKGGKSVDPMEHPPEWFVDADLEFVFPETAGLWTSSTSVGIGNRGYPMLAHGEPYHTPPETLPPLEPLLPIERSLRYFPDVRMAYDRTYVSYLHASSQGGKPVRGWVRLTWPWFSRPELLLIKLWPFQYETKFCSDHRCRELTNANYVTAVADLNDFSSPRQLTSQ
jgi:hypothetical protein